MVNAKITSLLFEKVALKQAVTAHTNDAFAVFRESSKALLNELQEDAVAKGKNIPFVFSDRSAQQFELMLGDDYLVFLLQPGVSTFDSDHDIWKNSFVKDERANSFVGRIYVYNFLADSFTFSRSNDLGDLVARIFINRENHFFVEGRRQLGVMFNDFANAKLDANAVRGILEAIMLYSLDFDPFTPPFDGVQQITVNEVMESTLQNRIATGKRLGFRFQSEVGPY